MNRETDRMKLAYWANIIRESKTSGMKISEWCVSNQISIRKYYYWHKKVMHSTYTLAVENGYLPDIDNPRSSDELPSAPDFAELSVPHRDAELDKINKSDKQRVFTGTSRPDSERGMSRNFTQFHVLFKR